MPSLEILEGLIGTACAVACLYYARLGALVGPQSSVPVSAPWHGALTEYARRNPFALLFGALALGFLISSWSMYALPRSASVVPRTIEKWHTITKNVSAPDPAQAAKITTLQTTVNTDAVTIAAQTAEIDRLKQQLLGNSPRRGRRASAAGTNKTPGGTAADLNKAFNPANAPADTAAPASAPLSLPAQSTVTPPASPPAAQSPAAGTTNSASPDSSTTPH